MLAAGSRLRGKRRFNHTAFTKSGRSYHGFRLTLMVMKARLRHKEGFMKNQNVIPMEGFYVSSNNPSLKLIVTEVIVIELDEEEDDPFFVVNAVNEDDDDDISLPAYEFIPNEWWQFVRSNQLKFVPETHIPEADLRSFLAKVRTRGNS
jgi:hypothetical protein